MSLAMRRAGRQQGLRRVPSSKVEEKQRISVTSYLRVVVGHERDRALRGICIGGRWLHDPMVLDGHPLRGLDGLDDRHRGYIVSCSAFPSC